MTIYRTTEVQGVKIFSREAGNPTSSAILLLHGLPGSSYHFRNLIPFLDERFCIIAPDYPGVGNSEAPDSNEFFYTLDHLADVLLELIQSRIGERRFSIYMQSEGASVGLRIASKHPDLVECLLIQNGSAYEDGVEKSRWEAVYAFWDQWTPETEKKMRNTFCDPESLRRRYQKGVHAVEMFSPDIWNMDSAVSQLS